MYCFSLLLPPFKRLFSNLESLPAITHRLFMLLFNSRTGSCFGELQFAIYVDNLCQVQYAHVHCAW